jgi:DNA-binding transcriptional ArsR family regulator
MQRLSATVLAINGSPTVNPGPLRELVLPLAQGIRGGVYGQNVLFVSSAFDGVKEFVRDLAVANEISLYWTSSPDRLEDATPLGEVTPTELETLQAVRDAGGGITVSDLATRTGLEPTAAGNRLVNLAKKGYVYRLERPRREGDLYIDPRGPLLVDAGQ